MNALMRHFGWRIAFITLFLFNISLFNLAYANQAKASSAQKNLTELEASTGGRIGVAAVDTSNNQQFLYRADERFPMGCTSKVMGVSAILKRSMTNASLLNQNINYGQKDLVSWSPITTKNLPEGMSVSALCAAAISYSDNTAMNLIVEKLGGLQEINNFAHSIGNTSFRQDHAWPEEALSGGPGNVNDSATPAAMVESLQQLALGDALAPYQRGLLVDWLKENTTGDARIRAGVPKGWVVGDKTGTGVYGTTNDIAIIWPPHCAPIVVGIYFTQDLKKNAPQRNDIVAAATRIILKEFSQKDQCISKQMS